MTFQTLAAERIAAAGSLTSPSPNLVLYDGVCALCNGLVRFLLRIDRRNMLAFAPLQGQTAARIAERHQIATDVRTIVYVRHFGLKDERAHTRSDAVLRLMGDVGGVWWLLSLFRLVPRFVRDPIYDFVARHRYRWFGQYDQCPLPPPGQRAKFLP